MLFGGMVVPVALGLWSGGLLVMLRAWCKRHGSTRAADEELLLDPHSRLPEVEAAKNVNRNASGAGGSQVITADLDFRGPKVGVYSIEKNGTLWDLNDHYSRPREIFGILVRSPVEFGINAAAFLVLLWMTAYATQATTVPGLHVGSVDWLVTPFKLSHLFFHSLIHVFPNYSRDKGMGHMKCPRIICGIVFGLSRYAVFLILAFRYSLAAAIALGAAYIVLTPLRLLGELLKTAAGVAVLGVAMCSRSACSGNCYVCAAGGLLQLLATGSFYLVGQCGGHRFREWRREDHRAWIPYHVVSDLGNALWIIGANYNPGSTDPIAFDIGIANATFPSCGWR